jgi:hypothetical protein
MNLHYLFHCKNCDAPIVLHAGTLGRPFEPQAVRTNDSQSVAATCFQCKHIGSYSALGTSPDYDSRWQALAPPQNVNTEFFGWLECEDRVCRTPLPLFSPVTATMAAEEREAEIAAWIWDGLRCPSGHTIRKPVLRLETPFFLSCPSCDAPGDPHTRDWFHVGKKVECGFCGKTHTVTADDIRKLDD